ncbi:hypothetical protein KYI92_14920 [Pantoea allii]|uniref:Uncharacterized protein n=1 Tax=Pantoea allii TaxID=574096 RepID=A0ABS6VIH8_9GAMM|nr:hypothetical protein [Pantoea allii]MBW1215060.1 hypothetical protein [Pantoea allii]MBW1258573.1 hypothetical protein [Pantoea allii]MBW1267794.1 hypothetical protein [Pantoea allii]MBW1289665.1 hypothetical protein [Pantoea allii]
MFKFDMLVEQNYASFYDAESGKAVFVDSFDNEEFDVRVGTLRNSQYVTTVHACNDEELNKKLKEAAARYL